MAAAAAEEASNLAATAAKYAGAAEMRAASALLKLLSAIRTAAEIAGRKPVQLVRFRDEEGDPASFRLVHKPPLYQTDDGQQFPYLLQLWYGEKARSANWRTVSAPSDEEVESEALAQQDLCRVTFTPDSGKDSGKIEVTGRSLGGVAKKGKFKLGGKQAN
jgi:hypothetical protein